MVRAERRQSRPHDVLGRLLQRPNFWRRDHPLPIILVAGPQASKTVQWLSEPFKESLPFAAPENDNSPELGELVDQIAGEHGLLGTPVSASFLPAPRFPLAQFVLWSLAQRDIKPEGVAESETWPTDLRDRKSQEVFKARLRSRRYARLRGEPGGWPTWLDFLARAFIVWIPGGTLAALGAGLIKNIVSLGPGFIGLIIGLAVGVIGLLFQTFFSITGSIFSRWFARQPYLRRKPFERLWRYGLRIACTANTTTTSANEVVDRLLVHAMLADLRQAYKKWWFPWPSWGRGRYSLLVLSAEPKSVHRHFLDVMTDVIEETGKFAPLVVLVSASSVDDTETRPIAGGKEAYAERLNANGVSPQ